MTTLQTLYIDRRDTELAIDGERLLVRLVDVVRPISVPLAQLQTVVISACTQLNSKVLQALADEGIALVILNPNQSDSAVYSLPQKHGHAARRLAQYSFCMSRLLRAEAANKIIHYRITDQAKLLIDLAKRHFAAAYRLNHAAKHLNEMANQVVEGVASQGWILSIEQLRGLEGAAARLFFEVLGDCLPDWTGFAGRNRRPPKDAVNVALSLTYTYIHAEATRALYGAGLDPMLGFYHEPGYGRDSLACDLTELLRGRAESWVVSLFNEKVLRIDHFSKPTRDTCLMSKAGRAIFYQEVELQMLVWRQILRRVSRSWVSMVDEKLGT